MNSQPGSQVDFDARSRAQEAVSLRDRRFPTDAVGLLAEEVLSRLASRFLPSAIPSVVTPTDATIDEFVDTLLSSDPDEGLSYVLALQDQEASNDIIHLGYLAGAARRMGERWMADTLSFTDVTLGAGRLYIVLRALRLVISEGDLPLETSKTALFCSTPGEDHLLGVTMAADMFRERGWVIDLRTGVSHDDLVQVVSDRRYRIIGLSASSRRATVPLARLIASFRVINPASYIVVSGELTAIEEDLGKIVDADFTARDALEAIEELHRFAAKLAAS